MYNRGDLVYVPSKAVLSDSEVDHNVKKYVQLRKPECFLIIEERKSHLLVEKSGVRWFVKKENTYKIGEKC